MAGTAKVALSYLVVVATVVPLSTGSVLAYEEYAQGCQASGCHGNFRISNYVSKSDGQAWGTSLHDGHRFDLLSGDCSTCHTSPSRSPVFLDSSDGGDGLAPLSCIGCHGRNEGSGFNGAGLRQHHWNSGVTVCFDCHSDASPSNFTPVDEAVMPLYYANPGNNHPNMPTDPCNRGSSGYSEDILGAAGTGGLDNDGDGAYDTDDGDCPLTPVEETTWGHIKALYE